MPSPRSTLRTTSGRRGFASMTDKTLAKLLRQALCAALLTGCGGTDGTPRDLGDASAKCGDADADGCTPPLTCSTLPDGAALPPGTICLVGRRPPGLRPRGESLRARSVGAWFARMAELEAASVDAFRILRAELAANKAPRRLIIQAREAEHDEIHHAQVAHRLARRFGAAPRRPLVCEYTLQPLEAMALENVVEGCVRETFGALVAKWQSCAADEADVRQAMRRIAVDETRHAALAWRVASWLQPKLRPEARTDIRRAKRSAIRELYAQLREPSNDLRRMAGLPTVMQGRALLMALEDVVWERPAAPARSRKATQRRPHEAIA